MKSGLTAVEQQIADSLVMAWALFATLPGNDADELNDFRQALHTQQRILALRVANRAYPGYWFGADHPESPNAIEIYGLDAQGNIDPATRTIIPLLPEDQACREADAHRVALRGKP